MKLNDNYELLLEKINCAVDIKQPQTLKLHMVYENLTKIENRNRFVKIVHFFSTLYIY